MPESRAARLDKMSALQIEHLAWETPNNRAAGTQESQVKRILYL